MRQIERTVCGAFMHRDPAHLGNSGSTGRTLTLHGHEIARWHGKLIFVTTAGWDTATTCSRLRAVGARVSHRKHQLYLGDHAWDGGWTPLLPEDVDCPLLATQRAGECPLGVMCDWLIEHGYTNEPFQE